MDFKFKKLMAIVVLSVLTFTSLAVCDSQPNKPGISKTDSSAESSEREVTTKLIPEGDNSADLIEAKLAKEYYKDCVQNLKWALGIIVGLVVVFIGYALFKNTREYRQALADVKEALSQAREACREGREASDKARDYEEKAQESLSSIDKEVANELKEIEEKGKVLITELIQEGEKQREAGREEAEKQRKLGELFSKYFNALQSKDFVLAVDYCEQAFKIDPKNATVLKSWGAALLEEARTKHAEDAYKLFTQSCEKYEAAITIEPDHYDAWDGWGICLTEQAKIKREDEADKLFAQSYEKYKKALEIKPDGYLTWNNWGTALSQQAKTKRGEEADKLFNECYEKYEQSLRINPEDFSIWNNRGGALLYQAQKKGGKEKQRLLDEAKEKLQKAESFRPGSSAYNLACLYAVLGDENECERWLKTGESARTLVTREHAMSDLDLQSMHEKKWFKEIRWADDVK